MNRKLILLVSLYLSLYLIPPRAAADSNETVIGAILPLSGESASWGVPSKNGIELALRDLKDKTGRSFRVVYEDDRCDAKSAVAAFRKLTEIDKARIILGPVCSSATLAVAPLAEKEGVLLLSFSEADSISHAGEHIFRLWVPNGQQGRKLARYIREKEALTRMAVLSVDNAFGNDIARAFQQEFRKLGGEVVIHETYSPSTKDFRTVLLRIRSKKPDGLFFASYIADGLIILRQVKDLKIVDQLFAASTINSPDFFTPLGVEADGLVFADLRDVTSNDFRQRYTEFFKTPWPGLQSGAPLFYDIVRVLGRLILEQHQVPSAVASSLLNMGGYQGVSGPISFNLEGDLVRDHVVYMVSQTVIRPIAE